MPATNLHVVTGAFGYSGKYIAARLLEKGCRVRTLTNSINRDNPFAGKVEAHLYNFDNLPELVESLKGAEVLYNTYWVRFNHRLFKHADAVVNTLKLFQAATHAGVGRVVHVSITNPDKNSQLEYFRGKAILEEALIASGLPYTILRPTVLFGKEDILINNIAWTLRHLPVFGIFGDGRYRLQPIFVDDLAKLAVEQGQMRENRIIDAIGPQTFTYRLLVQAVADAIRVRRLLLSIPSGFGYAAGWLLGKLVGDVLITRDEIAGLMADLLYTDSPAASEMRLTDWMKENAATLGMKYASELARRVDRVSGY